MDTSLIHNVEDEARSKLMINFVKYVNDYPRSTLSRTLENIIHLKDVSSYFRRKFENVGEDHISKEFDNIYNQDMRYKKGFEYLKENYLVKFLFYYEFDNE